MSKLISYKARGYENETLDVQSNEELISLMREIMAFIPAADDETFKKELAEQIKMDSGDVVRTDTTDNFVEDLIQIGFLTQVEHDKIDKD